MGTTALILLVTANVAVGIERTVLNPEFVQSSLEEEDVYADITQIAQEQIGGSGGQAPISPGDILSEEFVERQVERNIENIYSYLNGEADNLTVTVNTTALKDEIVDGLATKFQDEGLERISPEMASMVESEQEFQEVRQAFREQQFQQIQEETAEQLTEAELQEVFNDRKEEIRNQIESETAVSLNNATQEVQEDLSELASLRADALLDEGMTHEQFVEQVDTAMEGIAEFMASKAAEQLSGQLPEKIDITEQLGDAQVDNLETARQAVSVFSVMAYILPLIVILLSAGIWIISPTTAALSRLGFIAFLAGFPGAFTAAIVRYLALPEIGPLLEQQIPAEAADIALGMISQIAAVYLWQSLALILVGGVFIAASIALKKGFVPDRDRIERRIREAVETIKETVADRDADDEIGSDLP